MQPIEAATMIAILGRSKTTSPDSEPANVIVQQPVRRVHKVSPVRRTIGHWLTGLGGTLAGR